MRLRLTLYPPFRPPFSRVAAEGTELSIGRDSRADVVLDDDRVSRRHAHIRSRGSDWILVDEGSKNGTALDGQPIAEAALVDGNWVSFGGLPGRVALLTAEAEAAASRSRLERWQSAAELQRRLDPALGLGTLLERVLESVLQLTGTERGFVMLEDGSGSLKLGAWKGLRDGDLEAAEFRGSVGALSRALEQRSVVAVANIADHAQLAARPSVVAQGIQALLCVPLLVADRCVGVIYADSRRAGSGFEELEVEILEALAGHAALGLAVARVGQELRELAVRLAEPGREGAGRPEEVAALLARTAEGLGGAETGRSESPTITSWDTLLERHSQAG